LGGVIRHIIDMDTQHIWSMENAPLAKSLGSCSAPWCPLCSMVRRGSTVRTMWVDHPSLPQLCDFACRRKIDHPEPVAATVKPTSVIRAVAGALTTQPMMLSLIVF